MTHSSGHTSLAFDADTTVDAAYAAVRAVLTQTGLETPELDARLLLAWALDIDRLTMVVAPERRLGAGAHRLARAVSRRVAREPVARILGSWEFYGLPFELAPATLVPRPDTETVVDAALASVDRDRPLRVLDLGTGSGAILVALLHQLPRAFGTGIDISHEAVQVARRNANANDVAHRAAFVAGDWASAICGRFDLIVCNPPYVATAIIRTLAAEVRTHDPLTALDGGPDGLDAYRAIARQLPHLLAPGGYAVVEIGWDQNDDVRALLAEVNLSCVLPLCDLNGNVRALVARPGSLDSDDSDAKIASTAGRAGENRRENTWRNSQKRLGYLAAVAFDDPPYSIRRQHEGRLSLRPKSIVMGRDEPRRWRGR